MPPKTQAFDTVLKRIVTHHDRVRSFYLHFPQDQRMPFAAGQFVMAAAPRDGKIVKKPYSIASSPFEEEYVELCITRVDGGFMSNRFHNLKVGDTVPLEGPLGKFMMHHQHTPEEVIFVSTGTGIAPLRSIYRAMLREGCTKPITSILGVRYEHEVLYAEESRQLEAQHKNFRFLPTISRPSEAWKGEKGYVQEKLLKYFPTPENKVIYACGLVDMIQGLKKTALEAGYTKEQLHYEVWT